MRHIFILMVHLRTVLLQENYLVINFYNGLRNSKMHNYNDLPKIFIYLNEVHLVCNNFKYIYPLMSVLKASKKVK